MNVSNRAIDSRPRAAIFLTAWVLANLVGGFFAGFLENNGLQFMATLILTGAIVGSLQWFVLRPMGGFRWWPLASALGWIVSTFLQSLMQGIYTPVADALWRIFGLWEEGLWVVVVVVPLMIWGMAIAQMLILSHRAGRSVLAQGNRQIWGWLVVSLLGGAVSGGVSAALCAALCQSLPPTLLGLVHGSGWAAYGLITGLWLVGPYSPLEQV
ncbi:MULTISPECIES: hypothetical protein [Cyanophyceae]|uniref:Uncharacterized protein n=1 Tax=Leptolyngbya subtilissima DQ-A4 TaxID=2933933 RepID=A0ABV0K5I3_9CYAN|nr:hypothetical protein [Nodosilinea sp. FACHB-141]MBD2113167.1 hypothetical protein [Nodosilinea sp. FACHB-141]